MSETFENQFEAVQWAKANLKHGEITVEITSTRKHIKFWRDAQDRLCWHRLGDPELNRIVSAIRGNSAASTPMKESKS
jgi:hypothetical protein